jgi:hypothetical protein
VRVWAFGAVVPFTLLACGGAHGFWLTPEGGIDDDAGDANEGDAAEESGSVGPSGSSGGGSSGSCSVASCFLGCCSGNTCVMPTTDTACGALGGACVDCAATGLTCTLGFCSGHSDGRGGFDAGDD